VLEKKAARFVEDANVAARQPGKLRVLVVAVLFG
jgi:hypothetical protein